jgi:hypothetical protein
MQEIEAYREQESKEPEEKDSTFGSEGATMDNGGGGGEVADGSATLVKKSGGGAQAVAEEDEGQEDEDEEGGQGGVGPSGTLVVSKPKPAASPAPEPKKEAKVDSRPPAAAPEVKDVKASAASGAGAAGGGGGAAVGDGKGKQQVHPGIAKFRASTLVTKPGGAGGEVVQPSRSVQHSVAPSASSSASNSALDLRMSLISLTKAYEDELAALEGFYLKRKQQLQDVLVKKQTEAAAAGKR